MADEPKPQRVWMQFAKPMHGNHAIRHWSMAEPFEGGTEYVRADLVAEALELLRDGQSCLSDLLCDEPDGTGDPNDDPLVDLLHRYRAFLARHTQEAERG